MAENRKDNIYVSLDEAREKLKKRWNDAELRKRAEKELGENLKGLENSKKIQALDFCK